jgi:hypothetical protein
MRFSRFNAKPLGIASPNDFAFVAFEDNCFDLHAASRSSGKAANAWLAALRPNVRFALELLEILISPTSEAAFINWLERIWSFRHAGVLESAITASRLIFLPAYPVL